MEKESYVCILCPLYGVDCDGVSQEDIPVDDTKVASEPTSSSLNGIATLSNILTKEPH